MTLKKLNGIEYTKFPEFVGGRVKYGGVSYPFGALWSGTNTGEPIRNNNGGDLLDFSYYLPVNLSSVYLDLWIKTAVATHPGDATFDVYVSNFGVLSEETSWNVVGFNPYNATVHTDVNYTPVLLTLNLGNLVAGKLHVYITNGNTNATLIHNMRLRWS